MENAKIAVWVRLSALVMFGAVASNAELTTEPVADHSAGAIPLQECDGSITWRTYGTRKGHIGPGMIFLLWGIWWTLSLFWSYLSEGPRYRARSWYRFLEPLGLLEPALKVLGPCICLFIELRGDHSHFQTLTCPDGEMNAGKFALTHMNNWLHASLYPAFILSGFTDIIGLWVQLPSGLGHGLLGLAFGTEALLLGFHGKHNELDQVVHTLQVYAAILCAAMVLAEGSWPQSAAISAGKCVALMLQGAWLIRIADIMWTDDPRWSLEYPGSHHMAPLYFAWVALLIVAVMLAAFVVAQVLYYRYWLPKYELLLPHGLAGDSKEEESPAQIGGTDWAGSGSNKRQPSQELFKVSTPNQGEWGPGCSQHSSERSRMAVSAFNVECSV